jgi:hypothetical protein
MSYQLPSRALQLDLEAVRYHLAMGDGVHYLDGLIASVGGTDISSHRYTAWKLERSLLLWTWQPRSHEVLDESGYPHPEASQLGMHTVRDHDRLFQLAACD